jgi:Zn-dependent alcohol dehydrogenase
MSLACQAIVSYKPTAHGQPDFRVQSLSIRDIREDECLVQIVATGLCHTDLAVASRHDSIYPRVLGHEGIFGQKVPKVTSHMKAQLTGLQVRAT